MSVFSRFQGKPMPDSRSSCGGVKEAKPIANYKPPVGPKGIDHKGPGLGGPAVDGTPNHGNSGTQGKR